MLQYPFYPASRTAESPKSGNNFTRGNILDRAGDQKNVEQGCNFSSKISGGSVSELIVFRGEKRWGNRPVINPKELNKMVAHFKMTGLFLLRECYCQGTLCERLI